MYRILLLTTIIAVTFSACNSPADAKKEIKQENISEVQDEQLPSVDPQVLKTLYEKCEAIEITFYDAPISMASNKDNTRSFLSFITREPVYKSQLRKKALGIMSYNVDGDIFVEAEFYVDPNNPKVKPYFKFIKDKKYTYNVMSTQGYNLLTQPLQGLQKQK